MTNKSQLGERQVGLQSVIAPLLTQFKRSDSRASAVSYITGLLGTTERKTSWQMAEAAGKLTPYAMQHLLGRQNWDADASIKDLQQFSLRTLGKTKSALILDETGFIKKGDKSAGVQRQYTGTAGRIENSQVGVFLAYATQRGHTLVGRRLFMPESWSTDPERLKTVQAPKHSAHETKIKLAISLLNEAQQNGLEADWVLGDEVYGNAYKLRNWCYERRQKFALGVSTMHCIWADDFKQVRVKELFQRTANKPWKRISTGDGTKGPRKFDWKILYSSIQQMQPGYTRSIVARRSLAKESDVSFFSVYTPDGVGLTEVARAIGQRWKIEECFESAKGEVGLDHYEVRSWHGWHRHMTLAMWAHVYLVHCACAERQKKSPMK